MNRKLEIQKTLIIRARPSLIFKVLTDVENWNTWTASVRKSSLLNGAPFAIGTKVKIVQPKLLPLTWEITEIRDNNSFTWVSNSFGLRIIAKHLIQEAGDFSIVWLVTMYKGFLSKFFYNLTSDLTEKYMTMEAAGLKLVSEQLAGWSGFTGTDNFLLENIRFGKE